MSELIRRQLEKVARPAARSRSRRNDPLFKNWKPSGKATPRDLAELPGDEVRRLILTLEEEMHDASAELRFEYAARLRDEIKDLKRELREVG